MGVFQRGRKDERGYWVKGDGGLKIGYQLEETLKTAGCITLPAILRYSAEKYGTVPCMGTRDVLRREYEQTSSGKKFEKLEMGEYRWMTYAEVMKNVDDVTNGLQALDIPRGSRVAIFAETRAEWFVAAVGCLQHWLTVVTLYPNLNDAGISHGLNETEVGTVFTSYDLLPRLLGMLVSCPKVFRVIVMEDQLEGIGKDHNIPGELQLLPFRQFLSLAPSVQEAQTPEKRTFPTPEQVAIIMYTSGSTGNPKGVELTHMNIFCAVTCYAIQADLIPGVGDRYLAYLPLAHVMELATEAALLAMGITIAYSSPNTLTNNSTKIKRGTLGDARVAKPTAMNAVPLILERIIKGVAQKVESQGKLQSMVFNNAVRYKEWASGSDFASRVLDALIFRRVKEELGGCIRMMVVGGAPLSAKTHATIKAIFGCTLQIGYGSTETAACITSTDADDVRPNHTGAPNHGVMVRLVDWSEGGYLLSDHPNARGEIVVGGPVVAKGYFNLPSETAASFSEDSEGVRWFHTGDVGEFDPTGVLRIIDRKNDLLKLKHGEYISLGRIELLLKTHPLVENICVFAQSTQGSTVALVVPVVTCLRKIAAALGLAEDTPLAQLCEDSVVCQKILAELQTYGKKQGLDRWETPAAVHLTHEHWTPENGLVTAALKLRRKPIQSHFQSQVDHLYQLVAD